MIEVRKITEKIYTEDNKDKENERKRKEIMQGNMLKR